MQLQIQRTEIAKSPLFLVAPFFFLGTAMVVMKFIIPHTTPLFLAAFRLLPAGVLILLLTTWLKLPQPKTWQAWLWIGVFALVDGSMFQGFLTEGLVNTGTGLGAILIDAQPLLVALLSRLLFAELIGFWGWLGLAIGMAGICLCGLPGALIDGLLQSLGISRPFDVGLLQDGELPLAGFSLSDISFSTLLHSGEFLMLLVALARLRHCFWDSRNLRDVFLSGGNCFIFFIFQVHISQYFGTSLNNELLQSIATRYA